MIYAFTCNAGHVTEMDLSIDEMESDGFQVTCPAGCPEDCCDQLGELVAA